MKSLHLSETPIWITQSEQLLALDGKTLLLCERDGPECQLHLSIKRAPPNGPDSGKIAIGLWQTNHTHVPFEAVQPGAQIPTKVCSGWSAYLDEAAVKQITNATELCDLVLRLPGASSHDE